MEKEKFLFVGDSFLAAASPNVREPSEDSRSCRPRRLKQFDLGKNISLKSTYFFRIYVAMRLAIREGLQIKLGSIETQLVKASWSDVQKQRNQVLMKCSKGCLLFQFKPFVIRNMETNR